MKAAWQHSVQRNRRSSTILLSTLLLLLANQAAAGNQLVLKRGGSGGSAQTQWTGIVDLTVDPGFDNARVSISIDGKQLASGLLAPYRLVVDLGPVAVQHRITVTAMTPQGKRTRWTETINEGMLPLSLQVKALDAGAGHFEVLATAPAGDPIAVVQIWNEGQVVTELTEAPYRFVASESLLASGFVQATARTKSGEEAADFWSPAGNIHASELRVRTIPIFVSVVDRDGVTHDNIDRSLFRIIDNGAEAKIIEFGKAFDQPISIALMLDASSSMFYSMKHAARAAAEFVQHALKEGDRCSVTAIQDVPRRKQPLTADRAAVARALEGIEASGRTALYDSFASAIRELQDEKNRRAIVVLTDGSDTTSNWSFDDIERQAREAGIPIYIIAYEGGDDVRELDRLRHLAAQTGGFVATATQQNLMARYNQIEKDLRAQFAITYQISDFGKPNEWRNVRVVVESPKYTARTIKGYFAP